MACGGEEVRGRDLEKVNKAFGEMARRLGWRLRTSFVITMNQQHGPDDSHHCLLKIINEIPLHSLDDNFKPKVGTTMSISKPIDQHSKTRVNKLTSGHSEPNLQLAPRYPPNTDGSVEEID